MGIETDEQSPEYRAKVATAYVNVVGWEDGEYGDPESPAFQRLLDSIAEQIHEVEDRSMIETSVEIELIRAATSICSDWFRINESLLTCPDIATPQSGVNEMEGLFLSARNMLMRKFNQMYLPEGKQSCECV